MPTILLRSVSQELQGPAEARPMDFGNREPLFVGHLVLLALFGVLSLQIFIYHIASAARDNAVIRAVVYSTYILLVVQVVMSGDEGVTEFVRGTPRNYWLGWFYVPVIGGIVGLGVQVLYAWRISILSQNRLGPLLLVAIWCCTSALCDLLIAGYMTYLLTRNESSMERTRRAVGKIVRLTIETNALTAAVAVTTVGVLLGMKDQNYFTIFSLILPSVYGNTLLAMMNFRIVFSQRPEDNVVSVSGLSTSSGSVRFQNGNQRLTGTHNTFTPLSSLSTRHTDTLRSLKDKQSDSFESPTRLQTLPELEVRLGHAI